MTATQPRGGWSNMKGKFREVTMDNERMITVSQEDVQSGRGHLIKYLEKHCHVIFTVCGQERYHPNMLLVDKGLKYVTADAAMEGLKQQFETFTIQYLRGVKKFDEGSGIVENNDTEMKKLVEALGLEGEEAGKFMAMARTFKVGDRVTVTYSTNTDIDGPVNELATIRKIHDQTAVLVYDDYSPGYEGRTLAGFVRHCGETLAPRGDEVPFENLKFEE